ENNVVGPVNCVSDFDQPWLQFLALVVAMMKNWIELNGSQFEVSDFIASIRCRFNILIGNCSAEAFIIGSSQNNHNVLAHKATFFLLHSCYGRAGGLPDVKQEAMAFGAQ